MFELIAQAVGGLMNFASVQQQARAESTALRFNASDAQENAKRAIEQSVEDERQFRIAFKRQEGSNKAAIGASGIKRSGSALEVLRDNTTKAEGDAIRIRKEGFRRRDDFLKQARGFTRAAKNVEKAGQIAGTSALLGGGAKAFSAGSRSGAF